MYYQLNTSKLTPIMVVFLTFGFVKRTINKEVPCYGIQIIDYTWTDRRPNIRVNMTLSDNFSLQTKTWIEKDIEHPVCKFRISQKGKNIRVLPQFNITARLCDLKNVMSTIPLIKRAFLSATKGSNYTLRCPLKAGFYVIDNLQIDEANRILGLMYRPNVSFIIEGGLYDEFESKMLLPLSTYRITTTLFKKECKA